MGRERERERERDRERERERLGGDRVGQSDRQAEKRLLETEE